MRDVPFGSSPIEQRFKLLMNDLSLETRTRTEHSFFGRRELIQRLTLADASAYGATVSGQTQLAVLLALATHYPESRRTASELAEAAGVIGKSTAGRALAALRNAGLVRRSRFLGRRMLIISWSRIHELISHS